MNPPSRDIAAMLDESAAALGLTFATNLFVGEMPTTPDACVTVYDTGGYAPEPGYVYERPTVQVAVRGARDGYLVAHTLAQDVRDVLNGDVNDSINSARYIAIWCESDVLFAGYDDNHRPLFTVNFRIHRTG